MIISSKASSLSPLPCHFLSLFLFINLSLSLSNLFLIFSIYLYSPISICQSFSTLLSFSFHRVDLVFHSLCHRLHSLLLVIGISQFCNISPSLSLPPSLYCCCSLSPTLSLSLSLSLSHTLSLPHHLYVSLSVSISICLLLSLAVSLRFSSDSPTATAALYSEENLRETAREGRRQIERESGRERD